MRASSPPARSVVTANEAVEIRPVREAEVPILLRLVRELAEYERLSDSVTTTEEELRRGLFGEGAGAEAVIAWDGAEAAGFAVWYETFSTFRGRKGVYLEDLFVVPAYRGRGIGKALVRHVAGVAVARGCVRLKWEVLRWNEPSIGFYESLGGLRDEEWYAYSLTGEALERVAK